MARRWDLGVPRETPKRPIRVSPSRRTWANKYPKVFSAWSIIGAPQGNRLLHSSVAVKIRAHQHRLCQPSLHERDITPEADDPVILAAV